MNILANAAQAIEGEGNIWIRTWRDGDEAVIEFKDDGPGIPESALNKIFDPFFTTKPVGSGTGLGLSISFGIIEKHQGRIEAANHDAPHGAVFTIRLPLTRSKRHG